MIDLLDRLRALSRMEHSDFTIGDEAADELERMALELSNARAADIHSCHAGCTRAGCVNVRLREVLKELVGAADDDSTDRWVAALNAAQEQLQC